ncbi:DUF3592 domain-containing protein [Reinekea sp.]|jgi:hypothetical protein|uniref:DUF3592 domain-containing protein n=1 Tax=Reinekea sp. TaxID=1970455 RepID=UPI0039899D57
MALKFRKPTWALTLFSLPFLLVGLGFLLMSVIPTLYLGVSAANWTQVPATLLTASLDISTGDSTTYQARASYQYEFQGYTYSANRVGINGGYDNIGSWQSRVAAELKRHKSANGTTIAFVNPKNPESALLYPDIRWSLIGFKMIFVIIFGGAGGLLFVGSMIEKPSALKRLKRNGKRVHQEAQSDHIYSSARTTVWVLVGITLVVNLMSAPVIFALGDELRNGNKLILLALIFPIVGFGLLLTTVREGYRLKKLGRSPLVLAPFPPAIGGYLGATVRINTEYDSHQRFKVSLSCIHRYTRRSSDGKSTTVEQTRWHEEGIAYLERAKNNKTLLRFNFNIPEGLPESTEGSHRYIWRVAVEGEISRSTFKRSFTVPVVVIENPAHTHQYLAINHPGIIELTIDRIDQLNADDRGNEFELRFPRFSYLGDRLASILFGSIFLGSGIGVYIAGAPIIFPIVFAPIGLAVMLHSVVAMLTAHRVMVRSDGVFRRSSFMGLIKKLKHFAVADLDSISIGKATRWESSHGSKRYFFAIEAKNKQGEKFKLVDRIEGDDSAQAIVDRFNQILNRP